MISHNHSWLPFNSGLAVFMDRKLLVSKQGTVLVLQDFGMVTTAHWCILYFIAASCMTRKMYCFSLCPFWIVPLLDRQEYCLVIHCHTILKGPICEHTQTVKVEGIFSCLFSLFLVWLSPIAGDSADTCGDPGTPAHANREAGNFKVRSKVRFTCAVGHTLYGSAERICFPNGTWSGRQPFCKRKGIF